MNDLVVIREYMPADKGAVMDLIRLNIPEYFAPAEEADLEEYLDSERELYYVLLFEGKIVGCGGINFADPQVGRKTDWDILHPGIQGRHTGDTTAQVQNPGLEVNRQCPEDNRQDFATGLWIL